MPMILPFDAAKAADATNARPPHIMSNETVSNLEQPSSREELHQRASELNAGSHGGEERVNILPHPAKDNNPDSLKEVTGDPTADATKARPPHIVSNEQASGLGEPLSRDEIRARAEQLNQS